MAVVKRNRLKTVLKLDFLKANTVSTKLSNHLNLLNCIVWLLVGAAFIACRFDAL